jgi:hypothetical protein
MNGTEIARHTFDLEGVGFTYMFDLDIHPDGTIVGGSIGRTLITNTSLEEIRVLHNSSSFVALVTSPVPEPASICLTALGAIPCYTLRRRLIGKLRLTDFY